MKNTRRIFTGTAMAILALGLAATVALGQSTPPPKAPPTPNYPVLPGAEPHLPGGVRLQPPAGAPVDNQVVEITKRDPVTGEEHTVRVPYVAVHQLEREPDGSVTDWVVDPPDLMDRVAAAARSLP